jgi:hypothetical protein
MIEPEPGAPVLRLAEAVADGAAIDWKRERGEAGAPGQVRSLELIDSVFREYGRAADVVRGRLREPLLRPDSRWGPLRVLERIGTGTFGQVYRAFDPALAREVALKIFRDEPRREGSIPLFLEEARRLARVRHPGVLTVYGVAVHQGRAGIWTELVRGHTLERILLEDGPVAPEEAARIGISLCSALSAIHAAGLIHRDVKTQNVMRENDGRVILADFGAMDERFDEERANQARFGSLLSVAPEIVTGGRAGPTSDVYSLGVLLYRIVSGRYPIEAESPRRLLDAVRRGAPPLRDVAPSVTSALAAAIDRALDSDPGARFAGPNAMAQALQAALDPSQPARPAPAESYAPPRPREAPTWIVAAATLAISIGVAAGVYGLWIPWVGSHVAVQPLQWESVVETAPPPAQTVPPAPAEAVPAAPAGLRADPVLYRVGRLGREPLADGAVIRAGDGLLLQVETGAEPVTCYVLDEDQAGNDYVLFPARGYHARNPLQPAGTHSLPDGDPDVIKGRLTWQVDSENGHEDVVVITSLDRIPWFERSLRGIPRAGEPVAARAPAGTRGIGSTAPPPPTGRLGAILERLRSSQEFQTGRAGIWRIGLEAPAARAAR